MACCIGRLARCGVILTFCAAGNVHAACPELSARFQAAVEAGDIWTAEISFREIDEADECVGSEIKYARFMLSNLRALELEREIEQRVADGGSRQLVLAEFGERIEYAQRPAAGWRVLALVAEQALASGEYGHAARLLHRAADILNNTLLTPIPPAPEQLHRIVRMGEQADLLAPTFTGRGMASRAVRGYTVESVITPVTFYYDSDRPTAKGQIAIRDIHRRIQDEPSVIIHGHTDPVGGDDYNLDLSERRALKVAALLREKGYQGQIRTQGHGRSRPLVIENRDYFSDQEICQILRRVELQLDDDSHQTPFRYAPADTYYGLACK